MRLQSLILLVLAILSSSPARAQVSTGNGTPGIFAKTRYVNASGTTIANGRALTNAFKSLGQNETLVIGPGIYWTPTNTNPSMAFSKDNRQIHLMPGATWINGVDGAVEVGYMFDDFGAKVTNVAVTGWGNFIQSNAIPDVLYLNSGSKVFFEHQDLWNVSGAGGSAFSFGSVSNNLIWRTKGSARVTSYDLCYFDLSAGHSCDAVFEYAETVGDFAELLGDSPQWGLVKIYIKKGVALNPGQEAVASVGGRAHFKFDHIKVAGQRTFYNQGATTNGLIEGGTIEFPATSTYALAQDVAASVCETVLWFKNVTAILPQGVDCLYLTNSAGRETVLQNCAFITSAVPTNWARGQTPSNVRIIGSLGLNKILGVGANITVTGTNVYKTN